MHLNQMFPKKTLDAEDLRAYSPTGAVVTIEAINFKTIDSRQFGEPGIVYFMKVREFKKPFKLNKTNGYAIGQLLGTEHTEQWIGQVIRLMPSLITVTDNGTGKPKKIWTFDVDMLRPSEAPSLPPNSDITGMAYDHSRSLPGVRPGPLPQGGAGAAMGELTPIGEDKAADIAISLSERGRTLSDLAKHIDAIGLGAHVENRLPPAWPQAILPVARKYCSQLPKCAAPMSPSSAAQLKASWRPAEVVNKATGEVIQAPPPATPQDSQPGAAAAQAGLRISGEGTLPPAQAAAVGSYPEINEDDIPF